MAAAVVNWTGCRLLRAIVLAFRSDHPGCHRDRRYGRAGTGASYGYCARWKDGDASDEIEKTARAITDLFLASGEEVREAIEQGFLEHALESEDLRPYFEQPKMRDYTKLGRQR